MYDSRSDRRINFKQPTMTGKSTRKLTAKPKCNDRRADRRINSLAAWELQRLTVQGKGLVPTFSASQKLGSGPLLRALPRDPSQTIVSRFARQNGQKFIQSGTVSVRPSVDSAPYLATKAFNLASGINSYWLALDTRL
jgi:hypothetical protein